MKQNSISTFLHSRTLLVIEACIVIFLVFAIGKEIIRRQDVQSEVSRLEQQIIQLEQQNIQLAQVLKEMTSDNFQEKEARLKLDLQKPGETVVLIPQTTAEGKIEVEVKKEFEAQVARSSNAEKWWLYFFGQQS